MEHYIDYKLKKAYFLPKRCGSSFAYIIAQKNPQLQHADLAGGMQTVYSRFMSAPADTETAFSYRDPYARWCSGVWMSLQTFMESANGEAGPGVSKIFAYCGSGYSPYESDEQLTQDADVVDALHHLTRKTRNSAFWDPALDDNHAEPMLFLTVLMAACVADKRSVSFINLRDYGNIMHSRYKLDSVGLDDDYFFNGTVSGSPNEPSDATLKLHGLLKKYVFTNDDGEDDLNRLEVDFTLNDWLQPDRICYEFLEKHNGQPSHADLVNIVTQIIYQQPIAFARHYAPTLAEFISTDYLAEIHPALRKAIVYGMKRLPANWIRFSKLGSIHQEFKEFKS